MVYILIICFNH